MGFYDSEKGNEDYIKLAEGFDGAELIEWLCGYLSKNSSVLEVGMGPGKDLDILLKTYRPSRASGRCYIGDRLAKMR